MQQPCQPSWSVPLPSPPPVPSPSRPLLFLCPQVFLQLDMATEAALRRVRRLVKKAGQPETLLKPGVEGDIDRMLQAAEGGRGALHVCLRALMRVCVPFKIFFLGGGEAEGEARGRGSWWCRVGR